MSDSSCSAVVGLGRVRLGVGLVAALTAALLMWSPSPAGAVAGYGDVPEETWYTNPVQWATDNAITNIVGSCFGPSLPVSRGETAVWLHNLEGQPAAAAHSFVDVTDDSQHDAVSWMAETGITTGTTPTTFAPNDTLTRGQAAAFLHRLAGEPSAAAHSFGDVVAGWQHDAVSWMAETGITTGTTPTTFAPNDTLTRAHLITFLYRYSNNPTVTVDANSPTCGPNNEHGQADAPTGAFKAVSAGGLHSCGLRADDTITCWGDNTVGQTDVPTGMGATFWPIGQAGHFKTVSAGFGHSCAVRADDTITCWGYNGGGQTDAPAGAFKAVSAGHHQSCGLRADDTITCWGLYNLNQGRVASPHGDLKFKAVSAGEGSSCGLLADDTIGCWGLNTALPTTGASSPTGAGAFKTVGTGRYYNCGIRADDTILCWDRLQVVQADAPTGYFKAVSVGLSHSCAVRADDTITCWGNNSDGQADAPAGAFKAVSAGHHHSCGLRADNTITCWGYNGSGQTDVPGGA